MIKLIELTKAQYILINFSILIVFQFLVLFIHILYVNKLKKQKPYAWVKEEFFRIKTDIKCELIIILITIIVAILLFAVYYTGGD